MRSAGNAGFPRIKRLGIISSFRATRRRSRRKIYFFGQNNASGEIEAIIFLGSNAGKTVFSQTSSQVNAAYSGIIARQCLRAQAFIINELRRLTDWDDEETNDQIVQRIAAAIDLVGEPDIYAAYQEMVANQESDFTREKLMTAISMARDESTDRHRVNLLTVFAREGDITTCYPPLRRWVTWRLGVRPQRRPFIASPARILIGRLPTWLWLILGRTGTLCSFWARIIKAGPKWLGVSYLIPDNAIPLDVIYDWTDQNNKPSIWLIDDPETELCRIAVAMQKGKQPSNMTFLVVEQSAFHQSRNKPVRCPGKSLDKDLNTNKHYEIRVSTLYEAIHLVRIFSTGIPKNKYGLQKNSTGFRNERTICRSLNQARTYPVKGHKPRYV